METLIIICIIAVAIVGGFYMVIDYQQRSSQTRNSVTKLKKHLEKRQASMDNALKTMGQTTDEQNLSTSGLINQWEHLLDDMAQQLDQWRKKARNELIEAGYNSEWDEETEKPPEVERWHLLETILQDNNSARTSLGELKKNIETIKEDMEQAALLSRGEGS